MFASGPLAAQDNAAASSPPPAAAEQIGPRELSNFSLGGTVTRRAEPRPETQAPARPAAESSARSSAPASPAPAQATTRGNSSAGRQAQADVRETVADSLNARPSLRDAPTAAAAASTVAPALPAPSLPAEPSSGFSPLPWIAALLALAAGAVVFFGRRQRRDRYAAAGVSGLFEAPEPQPAAPPLRRAPAPQPQAKQPHPTPQPATRGAVVSGLRPASSPPGVITSALRPWIELELEPSQALVTDEQAAIAFDVTLFNSGSAPARDVAVEARLINAGQEQDVELSQFYTSDSAAKDKIPQVAPLARITLKSAVRLPRSAIQEYEVEGRRLFMPMVAVNSRYRWSSGEGQSAASFLVGPAANDGGKLAPLRLDQGKRGWRSLAARRYEKGIRR